jgi:hypothetical protein
VRYKTLFRVLLKFLGVWLAISGLASVVGTAVLIIENYNLGPGYFGYAVGWGVGGFIELVAGLYLFFGGRWIVDKAIPGNRPYCHECGYDLSKSSAPVCAAGS